MVWFKGVHVTESRPVALVRCEGYGREQAFEAVKRSSRHSWEALTDMRSRDSGYF